MYPSSYIKDYNRSYLHFHKTYDHHIWQIGELIWGTATSKVTWSCDHLATLSHLTNISIYINDISPLLPRSMTAKLGKVEIYSKGPPSIKSFDALSKWSRDPVTDKKGYISTSPRPLATKLGRVVSSNAGLLSTKSHNLLIT